MSANLAAADRFTAEQYPSQIGGVALIDSSTPYQFDLPEYPGDYSMMKRAYALMPTVARTAIGKVMLRSGHATLPPRARNAARSFASSPRELRADRIELLQLPTTFNEAKALHTLNGKPLAVVSASVDERRCSKTRRLQDLQALRSPAS